MKREAREQFAWAIHTRSKEGHDFLGCYWQFPGEGLRSDEPVLAVRLFKTRDEARRKLAAWKSQAYVPFPDAVVVRVKVTVTEV